MTLKSSANTVGFALKTEKPSKTWSTTMPGQQEETRDYHSFPPMEKDLHEGTIYCKCRPDIRGKDPVTFRRTVFHHSLYTVPEKVPPLDFGEDWLD